MSELQDGPAGGGRLRYRNANSRSVSECTCYKNQPIRRTEHIIGKYARRRGLATVNQKPIVCRSLEITVATTERYICFGKC